MAKGVQLVRSKEEAKAAAASLLGKTLVTYQTGPEGQAIHKVWSRSGTTSSRNSTSGWRSTGPRSARS